MRRFERPRSRFEQGIAHGPADRRHPRGLAGRILHAAFREKEVPQVAARQDLAFGMAGLLKSIGRSSIERLGAFRIAGAIDVAVRQREPEIRRMLLDETVEQASPLLPEALLKRDLEEAI